MTYKHIKFDESAVMRSLQKQAIEKGIIKPKQIVKEASKQSSIYISDNLDENLSNLISGLKKAGMEDLASEISYKFIDYKKAESKLYGLKNGSDAEDLVNEAHPKGSYDLKDVEGDSTIEYLYDQHKKMMDVVKKKINKKAQSEQQSVKDVVVTKLNSLKNEIKNQNINNYVLNCALKIQKMDTPNDFNFIINTLRECQNNLHSEFKNSNIAELEDVIKKINKIEGFVYIKQNQEFNSKDMSFEHITNKRIQTKQEEDQSKSEFNLKDKYYDNLQKLFGIINNFGKFVNDPAWNLEEATQEQKDGLNFVKNLYNSLKEDFKQIQSLFKIYFNENIYNAIKEDPSNENLQNNLFLLKPINFVGKQIKFNGFNDFVKKITVLNGQLSSYSHQIGVR